MKRLHFDQQAPTVAVSEEVAGDAAEQQALWHLFLAGASSMLGPERVSVMQLTGLKNARKPDKDDPEDGPIWGAFGQLRLAEGKLRTASGHIWARRL